MAKKVLLLVGDFVEDYEAMVPFQAMGAIGIEVDAVAPDRNSNESVPTAIHDFVGFHTYHELRGHNFALNKDFDKVNPEDYDGLYIAGGRSAEYIRLNKRVIEIVQHFFEKNKPVAAICHGIQVLTTARVLEGRTLTAYVAVGPDIELAGGIWKNVPADQAVLDGNLVTSPAWPGHQAILKDFYKLLGISISL